MPNSLAADVKCSNKMLGLSQDLREIVLLRPEKEKKPRRSGVSVVLRRVLGGFV